MPIAPPDRQTPAQPTNPKPAENRLADIEIANAAFFGGFRGNAQVTAVAVALAESGGNAHAIGDVKLQDSKWGVSVGLWQIRTLKAQYRTGRERDYNALIDDDAFQARSAYSISSGGKNFRPWTTYVKGKHRPFLTRARAACNGQIPLTNRTHGENDPTGGTRPSQTGPIFAPDLPDVAGTPLRISGKRIAGELGALFTGGTLDLSMDESSMLTVSFVDDGYALADRYQLEVGGVIDYAGVHWLISDVSVDHQGATPITTFRAIASGVKAMKTTTTGARALTDSTTFMQAVARAAGLAFFGEPVDPRIGQQPIAPAPVTRGQTADPLKALKPDLQPEKLPDTETAWELGTRLAAEAGFLMFETSGTLYFASSAYLASRFQQLIVSVDGVRTPGRQAGARWVRPVSRPSIKVTSTRWYTRKVGSKTKRVPYATDLAYTVDLPRELAGSLRVGQTLALEGAGPYGLESGGGTRRAANTLISKVTVDLSSPSRPITVSSRINQVFKYAPSTSGVVTSAGGTTSTGKVSATAGRAVDMVTVALRQKGDRYVWGAEAKESDPDPDEFDCSELVQWACSQVGGYMPDVSRNQRAYCIRKGTSISVAKAIRTRGALLFMGNPVHHVAISLGDGKHTIEARGRAYGVNVFPSTRGFTSAGLVPSLKYD